MALEQYANNATTTINQVGGINNTSDPVTFTVTDASTFPTVGDFRVRIGTEILRVTSVSGNNLTAVRAQEGTAIASHTNGTDVIHCMTKASLLKLTEDGFPTAALASRPATGRAGRIFQPTNGPLIYRDDGSTWLPVGLGWKMKEAILADFAWVNQGTATGVNTYGGILMTKAAQGGNALRMLVRSFTAPYAITMGYFANSDLANSHGIIGPVIYDTVSTKAYHFRFGGAEGDSKSVTIHSWSDPNTVNAGVLGTITTNWYSGLGGLVWCKLEDDGASRNFYIGPHPSMMQLVYSEGNTTYLTPNRIGFGLNAFNASAQAHLLHWDQ